MTLNLRVKPPLKGLKMNLRGREMNNGVNKMYSELDFALTLAVFKILDSFFIL